MSIFDLYKNKPISEVKTDDFEIVTLDRIHEIVNPLIMDFLGESGFESFSRVMWVNSKDAPIRQVFAFTQWKGGKFAPRWGLSLDFVPHVSGNSVKWHRTVKSAQFDLTLDANDKNLDIYYTKGPDVIVRQAPHVVKESISKAVSFWNQYRSLSDLPEAVRVISEQGLWFNKSSIANAFIYAMNGMFTEGLAELQEYFDMHKPDECVRLKLLELLEKARRA